MTVLQEEKSTITLSHLVALHQLLIEHEDEENARKILELYQKLEAKRYIIGFTGHFSAGKSSMINALLDEEILPKSPIPTSGNIVEITSDRQEARVIFRDQTVKTYKQPYDINAIQAFCKDNQTVRKVELSTTDRTLPNACSLMDTPGIDAADDADRIMTESALHLVDALFYVMDYNHVQSEVNLMFLKQIQTRRIPFYIIVNQIDKHNDAEMSFQAFEQSVKQTFEQWHIYPNALYFSSLMDVSSPHNAFHAIKADLFKMLQTQPNYPVAVDCAVDYIIAEHKQLMKEKYEAKIESISTDHEGLIDLRDVEEQRDLVKQLQSKPEKVKEAFDFELNETLKNAYLMPATLRDKAELFLESQQSDFKVGFLGSKRKTEAEQDKRLKDFLTDVQDTIRSTIQWKLRDKMIELLNTYGYATPDLLRYTKEFSIDFTGDDAVALIKKGATLNGGYVLRYTDDMSAAIKSKFKMEAQTLWEHIQVHILNDVTDATEQAQSKLKELENVRERQDEQTILQEALKQTFTMIDHVIRHPDPNEEAWQLLSKTDTQLVERTDEYTEQTDDSTSTDDILQSMHKSNVKKGHVSIEDAQSYIEQTIQAIETLPGFQTLIQDLQTRQQKLTDRKLTIALFGAFSAGKSSFANALIGERLLPSSPNPTTAVINEIAPVTETHRHGTVVVHLKTEDTLRQDIMSLTKDISPPEADFANLIQWLRTENIVEHEQLNKMYQAYLQAILLGYDAHHDQLGDTVTIGLSDFSAYITDETIACYIESVTLYYDCALTRQGITLVDTPGADSVNARHTNVAFDFIKHADAILYVTYYNHAISRADRDFLIQLGRVKESFSLDKMFFIINAADLATSASDLAMVESYVKEQLQQFGIRQPSIFSVSSKQSLENKQQKQPLNEQMVLFEEKLNHFIHHELSALSIQAAVWDMTRAYEMMKRYKQTAALDDQEKHKYEQSLRSTRQQLLKMVAETDVQLYLERITQRIKRQLHYVGERFSIRFHEFFTDAFNPTTIKGTGKQGRQDIQKAFKHLLDQTGYELLQEVRAVSLRVEQTMKQLIDEVFADFKTRSHNIDKDIMLPMHDVEDLDTPAYEQAFLTIDTGSFQAELNRFKGTKSFFEKNEKEKMKDGLLKQLKPFVKQYIETHEQIMTIAYEEQWHALFEWAQNRAIDDIESYISNSFSMMRETPDMAILQQKYTILDTIHNAIQIKTCGSMSS